jgi:hypothetical protein
LTSLSFLTERPYGYSIQGDYALVGPLSKFHYQDQEKAEGANEPRDGKSVILVMVVVASMDVLIRHPTAR